MTTYMTRRDVLNAGATTVAHIHNGNYVAGRPTKEAITTRFLFRG